MIKLFSGIYVHFLTLLLFSVCYITGKLETFFITYLIMFIHETAHLAAAMAIGLKPSHMVFYPFGVNLRLKNKIVGSVADEIILYAAGPLANILMAILAKAFFRGFFWYQDFYFKNIILCILNLLPILPLDGGIIARKIFAWNFGYKKSVVFMRAVSALMIMMFASMLVYKSGLKYNFSAWFFLVFLVGNLFTAKEKYNTDILKELLCADRKKNMRRCRVLVMHKGENMRNLLKDFTNNRYNILCIIGENGEIEKIMSEREVIDTLLANY